MNQAMNNQATNAYLFLIGLVSFVATCWYASVHCPSLMIFCCGLMFALFRDVEWLNSAYLPSYVFTILILGGYELVAELKPTVFANYAFALPIYGFMGLFLALNMVELHERMKYESS